MRVLNTSSIYSIINSFQPSAAFHIETSHLFCIAKQMTCFYIKRQHWTEMDYPIWCQCSHLFYKCCRIWEPLKSMGATDTKWVNENLNYTSSFFIFFDWDVKLLECFSNCFNKLLCNTSNLEQNTRYWNLEFTIEKLDKPFLTNVPFPTP